MKRPEHDSHDPLEPERLLARGLRDTTPEFEARFDALRRRLAHEPARRGFFDRIAVLLRGRVLWLGAATAAAAVALAVALVQVRSPRHESGLAQETQWFAEMVALDESLRGALVLAEADAREVVSLMPLETPGGGS